MGLVSIAASAEVDKSIVLWLQFDDGQGNVAKDSSQYGNDGTINGCKWVDGKYGSGLEFDGAKSFVEVKDNDSLLLTKDGVTGVTIAVWLKTDQKNILCAITIEKGRDWGAGSYCLNYPGYDTGFNNKVRFQVYPKWSDSKSGTKEVSDNKWHYCAGTYDHANKKYRVYVDGKLETEEAGEANIVAMVGSAYIGSRAGTTMFYKGVMDELLVANIPFTEDMLKKHMDGLLLPVKPAGKLVTAWGKIKENNRLSGGHYGKRAW
jgi:hypothetical protein